MAELDEHWQGTLALAREVVELRGLKEVAFDLDIQASVLANALVERDRHELKWRHEGYFLKHAPNRRLGAHIVAIAGMRVEQRPPATPADENAALKAAIDEVLGVPLRRALLQLARQKLEER